MIVLFEINNSKKFIYPFLATSTNKRENMSAVTDKKQHINYFKSFNTVSSVSLLFEVDFRSQCAMYYVDTRQIMFL